MRAKHVGVSIIVLVTAGEVGLAVWGVQQPRVEVTVSEVAFVAFFLALALLLALLPARSRSSGRAALWWLLMGLPLPFWFVFLLWPLAAALPVGLVTGALCLIQTAWRRSRGEAAS